MTQKPSLRSNFIRLTLWVGYAAICFKASMDWLAPYKPFPITIWIAFLAAASLGIPATLAGIVSGLKPILTAKAMFRTQPAQAPETPIMTLTGAENAPEAVPQTTNP